MTYAENPGDKRRIVRLARNFTTDDALERLARMRESDPDRYDQLHRDTRMAVGYYLSAKHAAEIASNQTQERM